MSRWCDQSIHDAGHSEKANGLHEVAPLFGTLVAETILASVHVRAQRQAGHMGASDLIKTLQNTLRGGGRPHMAFGQPGEGEQPLCTPNRTATRSCIAVRFALLSVNPDSALWRPALSKW